MTLAMNTFALPESALRRRWSHFAAPSTFYALAGKMLPWCWGLALLAAIAGLAFVRRAWEGGHAERDDA